MAVWEGTQKAEFQGIPATGTKIRFWSMSLSTIVDGRIKELWGMNDDLAMMTQLGLESKPKEAKQE